MKLAPTETIAKSHYDHVWKKQKAVDPRESSACGILRRPLALERLGGLVEELHVSCLFGRPQTLTAVVKWEAPSKHFVKKRFKMILETKQMAVISSK